MREDTASADRDYPVFLEPGILVLNGPPPGTPFDEIVRIVWGTGPADAAAPAPGREPTK
jgi:hypothetical protein